MARLIADTADDARDPPRARKEVTPRRCTTGSIVHMHS